MSERSVTVDVAKGIGILLVVLGHNAEFREGMHPAYEAIYLFHMPLFFFLSGVTFKAAEPLVALRKRFRSLLVPYLAMGALVVAFDLLVAGPANAVDELRGILYGTGNALRFVPLWFLPCLLVVSMSATWLVSVRAHVAAGNTNDRATRRFLVRVAVVGIGVGSWIIASGRFAQAPFQDAIGRPLGLPWSLDLAPFVLGIFACGMLMSRARVLRGCPYPWLLALTGIALLSLLVVNGVSLDLNYRRMTFPLAALVGMAAGVAATIALSSIIARKSMVARTFSYLGSASLVLLMLHSPVQRRVLEQLAPWIGSDAALIVLSTGATLAIICVIDLCVLRRIRALGWVCYPRNTAVGAA